MMQKSLLLLLLFQLGSSRPFGIEYPNIDARQATYIPLQESRKTPLTSLNYLFKIPLKSVSLFLRERERERERKDCLHTCNTLDIGKFNIYMDIKVCYDININ